tara:strand:+ start:135 stop:1718 length:1584 start_codon:yes stop_codon:yes gene_type:complete
LLLFSEFCRLIQKYAYLFFQGFGLSTLAKRITANEFTKLAKEKFGNKFQYDLADYSKIKSKIKVFCNERDHFGNPHGWFTISGSGHLKGKGGCKSCQYQKGYLLRDINDFKFFARQIHGYKYDYSKFKFLGGKVKGTIICNVKNHGQFKCHPNSHLSNKSGCPTCYEESKGLKVSLGKNDGEKLITKFLREAPKVHKEKFDYSHLSSDLDIRSRDFIQVKCPEHGFINVQVNVHLNGHDCIQCSNKENGLRKRKDQDEFINECKTKWGFNDEFYSLVNYTGKENLIKLKCSKHGVFETRAGSHLMRGYGCKKCSGVEKKTIKEVIALSRKKHGDLYDYSLLKSELKNCREKIPIQCKLHGVFNQSAIGHYLGGYGCPECGKLKSGLDNLKVFYESAEKANIYCEIYLVRVKQYYKIGISEDTYKRDPSMYEEYYLIEPTTRAIAWCVEQYILIETQWMEPKILSTSLKNWSGRNELREELIDLDEFVGLILNSFDECKKIGWQEFSKKYKLTEYGYGWDPESILLGK